MGKYTLLKDYNKRITYKSLGDNEEYCSTHIEQETAACFFANAVSKMDKEHSDMPILTWMRINYVTLQSRRIHCHMVTIMCRVKDGQMNLRTTSAFCRLTFA